MPRELVVVNERREGIALRSMAVSNGDGLGGHLRLNRGGQQAAVKGAHLIAGGGRALGKNHQTAVCCQDLGQLILHGAGGALAALNEAGPGGAGKPADDGPVAHLGFGQEVYRGLRAQHHDVQPGHVIADPQGGARGWCAGHANPQRQDANQIAHPPARQLLALPINPGWAQSLHELNPADQQ